MRAVIDKLNMHEVTIAYGMTETSPVSTQSGVDDSLEHRVSTVGRVQPHRSVLREVCLLDDELPEVRAGRQAVPQPRRLRQLVSRREHP